MAESTYTGTGKVVLGPTLFGDIITLQGQNGQGWTIGKDAFLACTEAVTKDTKAQGLGKAMFSGEDLFIYRVGGQGLLWLTSFGAVDRLDVGCFLFFFFFLGPIFVVFLTPADELCLSYNPANSILSTMAI